MVDILEPQFDREEALRLNGYVINPYESVQWFPLFK